MVFIALTKDNEKNEKSFFTKYNLGGYTRSELVQVLVDGLMEWEGRGREETAEPGLFCSGERKTTFSFDV